MTSRLARGSGDVVQLLGVGDRDRGVAGEQESDPLGLVAERPRTAGHQVEGAEVAPVHEQLDAQHAGHAELHAGAAGQLRPAWIGGEVVHPHGDLSVHGVQAGPLVEFLLQLVEPPRALAGDCRRITPPAALHKADGGVFGSRDRARNRRDDELHDRRGVALVLHLSRQVGQPLGQVVPGRTTGGMRRWPSPTVGGYGVHVCPGALATGGPKRVRTRVAHLPHSGTTGRRSGCTPGGS